MVMEQGNVDREPPVLIVVEIQSTDVFKNFLSCELTLMPHIETITTRWFGNGMKDFRNGLHSRKI
jgi:hypothetical protein